MVHARPLVPLWPFVSPGQNAWRFTAGGAHPRGCSVVFIFERTRRVMITSEYEFLIHTA